MVSGKFRAQSKGHKREPSSFRLASACAACYTGHHRLVTPGTTAWRISCTPHPTFPCTHVPGFLLRARPPRKARLSATAFLSRSCVLRHVLGALISYESRDTDTTGTGISTRLRIRRQSLGRSRSCPSRRHPSMHPSSSSLLPAVHPAYFLQPSV